MFDAQLYRNKAEVEAWRQHDPIAMFTQLLKNRGTLSDAEVDALERQVTDEIEAAVVFAEVGTWEPVEELTRFVYSQRRVS
jgi:TPP-dependent pyruvate/acetoin dehydrogenase alpha subunit